MRHSIHPATTGDHSRFSPATGPRAGTLVLLACLDRLLAPAAGATRRLIMDRHHDVPPENQTLWKRRGYGSRVANRTAPDGPPDEHLRSLARGGVRRVP